jgi:hypothetical protein
MQALCPQNINKVEDAATKLITPSPWLLTPFRVSIETSRGRAGSKPKAVAKRCRHASAYREAQVSGAHYSASCTAPERRARRGRLRRPPKTERSQGRPMPPLP